MLCDLEMQLNHLFRICLGAFKAYIVMTAGRRWVTCRHDIDRTKLCQGLWAFLYGEAYLLKNVRDICVCKFRYAITYEFEISQFLL